MLYVEAKELLISGLLKDAAAHDERRHDEIGAGFDEFDGELPRGEGPEFGKLFVALQFWDGWIDAPNHDWLYYEPITEEDWPVLARQIVNCVQNDLEITNPIVIDKFHLEKHPARTSAWQKLKHFLFAR